jgi:two-component system, chemotaxis family, protein-glutamate methylesterase/glutaminase
VSARIRVLIVDDSAFVRKVLRELLSRQASLEVVGFARDGLEALEKIAELSPDVMTLDLNMPELDGLGVLEALVGRPGPAVVVVSTSVADSELAVRAFERGAVELVSKPTAQATDRLYELGDELVLKIHAAAMARRVSAGSPPQPTPVGTLQATTRQLVVIGTSTGGPQALTRLLPALPADFPLPIAVALHIPVGYTHALAGRINELSELEVIEAEPGVELRPGRVVIARGGSHLKLQRVASKLVGVLSRLPADRAHFPSVDVLFESAAEQYGAGTIGVVLTGMGKDGTEGARAIRAAGGVVLTEAEASCVVYGMPRSVVEAGLSSCAAPLSELSEAIARHV